MVQGLGLLNCYQVALGGIIGFESGHFEKPSRWRCSGTFGKMESVRILDIAQQLTRAYRNRLCTDIIELHAGTVHVVMFAKTRHAWFFHNAASLSKNCKRIECDCFPSLWCLPTSFATLPQCYWLYKCGFEYLCTFLALERTLRIKIVELGLTFELVLLLTTG